MDLPPFSQFHMSYLLMPMFGTDSFLFLFLSMIIIAASLYLPSHMTTIASRAWFYYAGDESTADEMGGLKGMGQGHGVGG